jgi:ElaA protein
MNFLLKSFDELTVKQLYYIYLLRSKVFVVEQNCAYQDIDDMDLKAYHLLLCEDDALIAYCRILPPGLVYPECAIGRVVVHPDFRKKQLGKLVMKQAIEQCFVHYNNQDIVLSAQNYLLKFYTELGFKTEGETYLEDDIPHTKMRLK